MKSVDELNDLPAGGGFTEADLEIDDFPIEPFGGDIKETRKAIADIKRATLKLEEKGLEVPAASRAAMRACLARLEELKPEEMPELDDEDIIRIADL